MGYQEVFYGFSAGMPKTRLGIPQEHRESNNPGSQEPTDDMWTMDVQELRGLTITVMNRRTQNEWPTGPNQSPGCPNTCENVDKY